MEYLRYVFVVFWALGLFQVAREYYIYKKRDKSFKKISDDLNEMSNSLDEMISGSRKESYVEVRTNELGDVLIIENPGRPGAITLTGKSEDWVEKIQSWLEDFSTSRFNRREDFQNEFALLVFRHGVRCNELDVTVENLLQIRDQNAVNYFSSSKYLADISFRFYREKEDLLLNNLAPFAPDFVHINTLLAAYKESSDPVEFNVENDNSLTGVYLQALASPGHKLKVYYLDNIIKVCEELERLGFLKPIDNSLETRLSYFTEKELNSILYTRDIDLSNHNIESHKEKCLVILTYPELREEAEKAFRLLFKVYEAINIPNEIEKLAEGVKQWQYSAQTASFILHTLRHLQQTEKTRRELVKSKQTSISCPISHKCQYHKTKLSGNYKWGEVPDLPAHPGCSCIYLK